MLNKLYILLIFYIYSISGFITTYIHNDNINLKSNIKKNNNINFVIWKGACVPSKNYIGFSKTIINEGLKEDININITICKNYKVPFLNNTILFGHSLGGYHCLNNNNNNLKAKITYGCFPKSEYIKKKKINSKLDIDTLNIIGEYDGLLSYNKLLDQKYYNIENNITNNKLICTKSNHFCITENKKTLISTLLCMYDNKQDNDYNIMSNDVKNVIISYIKYLKNNNTKILNTKYTNNILSKNIIFEIDNYKHFLKTKPDICKTYMYIDYKKNITFIKTSGIFGEMLLDILEYKCNKKIKNVKTSLGWLFNNDNEIILFSYKKMDYKYFKLPYIIK